MHPAWGFGFFILVNRAVQAEGSWIAKFKQPRIVTVAATVGVFSYSLYLTHELVIMQAWRFSSYSLPPIINTLLIITPATVGFAWLFYRFCERPFMSKAVRNVSRAEKHQTEEHSGVLRKKYCSGARRSLSAERTANLDNLVRGNTRRRFKATHFVNLHAVVAHFRRHAFEDVLGKILR